MDKDTNKKKIDFMKSIMTHPKLSRTFRDAMAAPIGSTKREQIKSTLSVMKKIGGMKNDGMGGPPILGGFSNSSGSSLGSYSPTPAPTTPNFSNLLVFPAAPKLKIKDLGINLSVNPPNSVWDNKTKSYVTPANNSFTGIKPFPEPLTENTKKSLSGLIDLSNPTKQVKDPFTGKMITVPDVEARKTFEANKKARENPISPPSNTALTPGQFGEAPKVDSVITPPTVSNETPVVDSTVKNTPILSKLFSGLSTITKPINIVGRSTNATLDSLKNALVTQESGGSYSAVNPDSGALGKYQIMPFNLGYAGLKNTPEDKQKFLSSPALQDKAYENMITELTNKYDGDLVKVAAAYYGGDSAVSKVGTQAGSVKQGNYPSINDYVEQVLGRIPELNVGDTLDLSSTHTVKKGGSGPGGALTYGDAQDYVDAGLGSYAFGEDLAKSNFGGRNLEQVIIDTEAKLKKDFNLEPLEVELSKLKAQSENFVPTLTEYIKGKDQYLSFIDKMIDSTQGELLKQDMGDPQVANRYTNYMNYLSTLKGRQSQRYGTYLNSAIADYNADVTKMQNNYNSVHKDFTDTLTRQSTLDQNTYNNLMTRGASLYTELQDAPVRERNIALLDQQLLQNNINLLKNGVNGGNTSDPDYWKKFGEYSKVISVDKGQDNPETGTIDLAKVGPEGLISLYVENSLAEGNQDSMTKAIQVALTKTLTASGNDPKKVTEIKKMIDNLRNSGYEQSGVWADSLNNAIAPATKTILSSFILGKIDDVKSATKDLVKGSFWGRKPGIEDKVGWMKDHANLGTDFLESLYNAVNTNVQPGTALAENPESIISQLFPSKDDKENANILASVLVTS